MKKATTKTSAKKATAKKSTAKKATAKKAAPKAAAQSNPAASSAGKGAGTKDAPWKLQTANGGSEYLMYRDESADPPALVCQVGSTQLRYHLSAIDDLHQMLRQQGDWVALGGADEQKPAAAGTVEAWGRAASNPVGGWYGLRKGYRGRFGMYLPPLLEQLGLVELEHNAKNNRVRAK
jgi:hypothetical protein